MAREIGKFVDWDDSQRWERRSIVMFEATLPPLTAGRNADLSSAKLLSDLGQRGGVSYELRAGRENFWVVAAHGRSDIVSLRCGIDAPIEGEPSLTRRDSDLVCDWRTALGAVRLTVTFPEGSDFAIRCTTSFLPARDTLVPPARDLFGPEGCTGEIHTTQRGLRTGIFYASYKTPVTASVLYLQNFSSLTDLFETTQTSPAASVGGTLAESGFFVPINADCPLPGGREFVISDALLAVVPEFYPAPNEVAGQYFDLLADMYLALELPGVGYHDWPERAAKTMRDLCLSPSCTYERGGHRYIMPYVGDTTKPPESMVQLTVLVNTLEYEDWRGFRSPLSATLLSGIDAFYDPAIGSVVRWLPGEDFGDQSEANMNHEAMDSWYLYHSLFNVSRLATLGNAKARAMLRKSLPFAVRVARRFDYRWPIFFNLKTLAVVRAESAPGKGGERDVAGLYALVMLHAHEMFGEPEYLEEAKRAIAAMDGLGFGIGYQTNTTGFAAEAALRLWLLTKERSYLELSELCLANIFDNMWLWECDYGKARYYPTFFGLFPLHDAPYLAAYEEMETQAKFHDYLALGKSGIRPSIRLLLAEYQKYALGRGWFYYPDALPTDGVAEKSRNGKVERALSIPLEDLQDGSKPSGEVGQELYGSGLPFVYSGRHYTVVAPENCMIFCDYPIYDFAAKKRGNATLAGFYTGGDARGKCQLRVIPIDAEKPVLAHVVTKRGQSSQLKATMSIEGHATYDCTGDTSYEIRFTPIRKKRG
jgi:hypothetical protein